jgi:hypothetical protein
VESWLAALLIGLIAALLAAVGTGWFCYRQLLDRGRILRRLEALETRLVPAPAASSRSSRRRTRPVGRSRTRPGAGDHS